MNVSGVEHLTERHARLLALRIVATMLPIYESTYNDMRPRYAVRTASLYWKGEASKQAADKSAADALAAALETDVTTAAAMVADLVLVATRPVDRHTSGKGILTTTINAWAAVNEVWVQEQIETHLDDNLVTS